MECRHSSDQLQAHCRITAGSLQTTAGGAENQLGETAVCVWCTQVRAATARKLTQQVVLTSPLSPPCPAYIVTFQSNVNKAIKTGRSLRIYRYFSQKCFQILVNKELIQVVTRLKLHRLGKQRKLTKGSGDLG